MEGLLTEGIESKIKDITVYRGGAFITRTAMVQLKAGRNTVTIEKLSATIRKDSIQVGVGENVSCLQVIYDPKANQHKVDPKVDLVDTGSEEKIREIKNQISILDLRLEMHKAMTVKFDIGGGVDKIKDYDDYNASTLKEIVSQKAALEKELEILGKKKNAEKSLITAGVWKLLSGVIKLEVESKEDQECEIEIQYFDVNADWKPHYDIRLDDFSKSLAFILKGNITQTTGESWINVNVSVSTGSYSQRRYKGDLPVWRVSSNHSSLMDNLRGIFSVDDEDIDYDGFYDEEDLPLADGPKLLIPKGLRPAQSRAAETGSTISFDVKASDSEVIDNQNSTVYKLAEKCTVYNNRGSGTVTVTKHVIECPIDIYTTPKLDCSAFMVAKVKDYSKYSFLACNANIFFNNRFVGQTKINPDGEDGVMMVSLGQDEKIIVKRIEEKKHKSKSFIGGARTEEEAYVIKLTNMKPVPAHIIVVDQIPVSTDSKVTVEVTNLSKGELEDVTGKVTWDIGLKPDENREIRLGYKIITKR